MADLLHELRTCRDRYAALIDLLAQQAPGDSENNVECKYAELHEALSQLELREVFEDWELKMQPDDPLLVQFRDAVSPILDLIIQIEHHLVVRSVASEENHRVLLAFKDLPFYRNRNWIEDRPFLTLGGLDAITDLLQGTQEKHTPVEQQGPLPAERESFLAAVRRRLDEARRGKSVKEFANDLATTPTVIYKLYKGDRRCSEETLNGIARKLGCSSSDLYREDYKLPKKPPKSN